MDFKKKLNSLKSQGCFRSLKDIDTIIENYGTTPFVNLSSNDYLSLGSRNDLRDSFLKSLNGENLRMTASSSRLLTGNTDAYIQLENTLCRLYGSEAALVTGSGYHANTGILPALSDDKTLILADKLIHASLIDGIKLSTCKSIRYRHKDYSHLERLIKTHYEEYETIIIVTESVFSMDGDEADIKTLVELRRQYPKILLYIDAAHAVGVRGETGVGCCDEYGCLADVDILVGTFGKALASTGAYIICKRDICELLVNQMRPFIFTTALPPINLSWSNFILENLKSFHKERNHLGALSALLHEEIGRASCRERVLRLV